jgi:tyrosine-protein kinase Etk/Wzc
MELLEYWYMLLRRKWVVVVNLDLHRPTVYKIVGKTFSPGVSDYLIGEATLEQILHVNVDSGVDVIGAGTIPPNPGELLASARLAGLIEALRSRYEVLLVDTPPMTLVAESLDVVSPMDGIVLVVNASTTPLRVIGQLRDMLIDKHLPICGFFANGIDKFAGASYGRYGKYAAYASEERGEHGVGE